MKTADEILKMVNEFLDHLSYDRKPESLYEPIKYVLSLSVLENVMFPLDMFSEMTYRDRVKRARICLDRVNLVEAENKFPAEISASALLPSI